jgi:chemotaxis protein CheC
VEIDKESLDAITEIINIGVGRSASLLNQMTNSNIRLRVPKIFVIRFKELADTNWSLFGEDVLSTVMLEFQGNFSGLTAILFPPESAASLVMLLSGENDPKAEMDAIRVETLKEVGNIIINSVMGSISNVLAQHLSFSLPVYYEGKPSSIASTRRTIGDDDCVIVAHTQFMIESRNIEGKILILLEVGSLESLVESLHSAYR